ncbi:MAG: TetR/AcrR family transcriptional regulator, partial [Puniceicoccales bacterium]
PRTLPRREDGMETRARLMRAAGMIFAQEGYQAASLRAICQSANANLGAVRYYFGGKEALYRETLFSTYRDLTERGSIADMDVSGPPDEALRMFTRSFIVSLMQRRRDYPYLPAMMMRELALPTNVFDELVREVFLPIRLKLSGIVRRLLEKKAPTAQIEETSNRIVLLVIQFALCRPLLERFPGKIPEKPAEIEAMAERVFTFIMHGINSRP